MIKPGLVIYVARDSFLSEGKRLDEYIVTKVNTVSFYAFKKDDKKKTEVRFDKRTLRSKPTFGHMLTAYFDKADFEEYTSHRQEQRDLKEAISKKIDDVNLDKLRAIYQIINEN